MYAQQANTGIAPLDAVLATAAMVTPDGGNTVAAQVAQAAAQKMQPQGIMQGMSGAREDFAAAAPSVMRNMQQEQMQGVVEQAMRPKPVGLEVLAAPNMETFAAAQGGVVGYAGPTGSEVEVDETKLPVDERFKRKLRSIYEAIETDYMKRAGATPEMIAKKLGKEPPVAPTPIPEGSDRRLNIPAGGIVSPGMTQETPAPRPPTPTPRPPARPSVAAPAAPTGIAAALAERPQYDVASIPAAGAPYMKAGEEDVARLRKAEGERAAFEKTLPDLSAKGIEALQQRMRDVEAAEAARKESAGLDRVIQQLLGRTQGAGGAARADIQFTNAQNAAADAFSQARLGNQQAQLLLEKAQQERQLGRFDRAIALEREASALMEKARDNALKAQDIRQRSAGAQFQGAVQMYEGAQNREANRKLEEYRRQTQLMKPHEIQMIEGLKKDKLDQLTGGKPETATAEQRVEATEFALQTVKGAGRAGGIDAKNNAAALRELGQWEKDVGANIKAMNAKNPQAYEDARRAKIREINAALGSTMPLDGGAAGAVDTNNPLLKK